MAKDKIFEPKDFDKDIPQNNRKKWLLWGTTAILLCIIIAGFILWRDYTSSQVQSPENTPLVSTVSKIDTISSIPSLSNVSLDDENKKIVNAEDGHLANNNTAGSQLVSANKESKVASENIDIEQEALKVIRGAYGNIPQRKNLLGEKYQIIQNRVNQLKKIGTF